MFKSPRIDWCKVVDGSKNANPILKSIVRMMKEFSPRIVKKCPLSGVYEGSNIKPVKDLLGMLPHGQFLLQFRTVDANKIILTCDVLLEISDWCQSFYQKFLSINADFPLIALTTARVIYKWLHTKFSAESFIKIRSQVNINCFKIDKQIFFIILWLLFLNFIKYFCRLFFGFFLNKAFYKRINWIL